jgi:hypothetical protein
MFLVKTIDEARLESDLKYRFEYLCDFIGFNADDIKTVTGAASLLGPVVNTLVDAVYNKLFTYDCTKRQFLPKQHGFKGATPNSLEELSVEHEQIKFRKTHLAAYLVKLVTGPYDDKLVEYLDFVGKIHTRKAGNKEIYVPIVQMNALMGFVADAINATVMSLEIPQEAKNQAIRSFSKLLWIQNDLINRHYAV